MKYWMGAVGVRYWIIVDFIKRASKDYEYLYPMSFKMGIILSFLVLMGQNLVCGGKY